MTTWYRIQFFDPSRIELVNVEHETPSTVVIDGRRHSKITDWQCFYKTRAEAKQALLDHWALKNAADLRQWERSRDSLLEAQLISVID